MGTSTDSAAVPSGTPIAEGEEIWGTMRLHRRFVLTSEEPPDHLLTSVRAVVFKRSQVVVVVDRDGSRHVMPGGRREPGETETGTLCRELAEETGWSTASFKRLGFLAFQHLTPKPDGYAYPYPLFLQSLFVVEADTFDRKRILRDEWETHSRLQSLARARTVIRADQPVLLNLAVEQRKQL